jgi:uncharacterized RDD family membrane protein YckC
VIAAEPDTRANGSASTPRLHRRLASMVYESILLFGVAFIAAYLFLALTQNKYPIPSPARQVFQLYMFGVIGAYFVWCWRHGGQTLPMKTWKMRVESRAGPVLSRGRAWWRYTAAWMSLLPALSLYALGYKWGLALTLLPLLWPLVDRERQFLHDRLAGTRIVTAVLR